MRASAAPDRRWTLTLVLAVFGAVSALVWLVPLGEHPLAYGIIGLTRFGHFSRFRTSDISRHQPAGILPESTPQPAA